MAQKVEAESIAQFISIAQNICVRARDPRMIEQRKGVELIDEVYKILPLESLADFYFALNNKSEIDDIYKKYCGFVEFAGRGTDAIQKAGILRDSCKEVVDFRAQEFRDLAALHSRYQEVHEKTSARLEGAYGGDVVYGSYLDGLSAALTKLEDMVKQVTPNDPCLAKFVHDFEDDRTGFYGVDVSR